MDITFLIKFALYAALGAVIFPLELPRFVIALVLVWAIEMMGNQE